jgi:16S rRNA (guanine527-N7)-methyltransferase
MERSSRELLPRRAAEIFGIELAADELRRIDKFLEILARWSPRINLVSAHSADEITDRHVLDSLALTDLTRRVTAAADFGSGAGFPGILMAITAPDTIVHLIEARERRSAFLREVARTVGLENVRVWPVRAEAWQPPERLALVAARALRLDVAAALALSVLTERGKLALMRKENTGCVHAPGFGELRRLRYRLPRGERHEVLVLRRRIECFT